MDKITGIGTDIIEIERIAKAVCRSDRFLRRVFTQKEREYFAGRGNKPQHIAGIFAAKEAAVKAAGGFLADYEVLHYKNGKPYILHEKYKIEISISHCKEYAVAVVVASL